MVGGAALSNQLPVNGNKGSCCDYAVSFIENGDLSFYPGTMLDGGKIIKSEHESGSESMRAFKFASDGAELQVGEGCQGTTMADTRWVEVVCHNEKANFRVE